MEPTVEPASTVELTAAMERWSTTSHEAATHRATPHEPRTAYVRTANESASCIRPAIEPAANKSLPPEPCRMSPVIPGPHANKDAIHEVVRPVVAIRSASIRSVIVIPICARRRAPPHSPARPRRPLQRSPAPANKPSVPPSPSTSPNILRNAYSPPEPHFRNPGTLNLPSDPGTAITALVWAFHLDSPSTSLYVFERSRAGKVAEIRVVDFSHLAKFQPLRECCLKPCRDAKAM